MFTIGGRLVAKMADVMTQMTSIINQITEGLPQIRPFLPAITILCTTLMGLVIELTVLRRLEWLAKRTTWKGDDIIIAALHLKLVFWGLLLGIALAFSPSSSWFDKNLTPDINNVLLVLFIFSLTMMVARICAGLITSSANAAARPALSIVTVIVRVTIYIIGFLIILDVFKINISPALAALGVGGLAVSLALQATLTDVVSGIQIIAARQIHPGDYIMLSSGEEGYVLDINWRTTTIRQLSNNIVIIPNSKMTTSIVVNYYAPEMALSISVPVGVSYDSDLEQVERVTVEVAKEVMQSVPGGIPENEPFIRYNAFGDSCINFSVILRGKEFTDQYLIKHEFIKRLHRRYQQEGITVPFPARTVYLRNGESDGALPLRVPTDVSAQDKA